MPQTSCSVLNCSNRGGHAFPKDAKQQKAWAIAVRRVNERGDLWRPPATAVVCHAHFKESDYVQNTMIGSTPKRRKLKDGAVPSVFQWSKKPSPSAVARDERAKRRWSDSEMSDWHNLARGCIGRDEQGGGDAGTAFVTYAVRDMEFDQVEEVTDLYKNCAIQTDTTSSKVARTQTIESGSNHVCNGQVSIEQFTNDPEGVQFYTGLEDIRVFKDAFFSLGSAVNHLNYIDGKKPPLGVQEQFFLTLIKLRQHKCNFELSRMFKIPESAVYSIFVTWVRFMALQWREVSLWPSRDLVKFYAPSDFRTKFPSTRAIFDGAECPVQKPSAPAAQQVTFSSYKNRCTAKVLVGGTPGGVVSFVSPAYGGSASDRQIVERTDLNKMCDPKDSIMADKGFDVQDIFAPYDVTVNIPTFFRKTNRMTGETVMRDRKISSKRVHIERLIGLGKTYKILCQPMNHSESILASDIIFICYMLCNFRKCIVPRNA